MSWSVQRTTQLGTPTTAAAITATPEAEAILIRFPDGQLVWNRPTGIWIENGGELRRIRTPDVTRIAQIGIFCLAALTLAFTTIRSHSRNANKEEHNG